MTRKSGPPNRKEAAWRIDGISPEAAAAAEQAAARDGVALSVWLGQVIRATAARERAARNPGSAAGPHAALRRAAAD